MRTIFAVNQLVKISNVSKKYLRNKVFNLEINTQDFILLSGQNGAGKSTLMKIIVGYIKPDFGKVEKRKKLKVSYLPEIPSLPLLMNAREYLTTISEIKDNLLNWKLVEKLEIPINKSIRQLSKGNKQMLSLVATLAGKNDIIILDEPLNGIDQSRIKIIKEEISSLHSEGISFIVSSHLEKHFKNFTTKVVNI